MAYTVVLHLIGDVPVVGEIEELPKPTDTIITVSNPLPFAVRVKLECEALAGGILSSRSLNPSPIIWVEVPPRSAKDMWAVTPDAIPCRMLDWVGVF